MKQLKERKDADPRYTWDFTDLYPSEAAWEEELNALKEEVAAFAEVQGTLGASAESLKAGLDRYYDLERRLHHSSVYAMFHASTDNGNPDNQRYQGLAQQLMAKAQQVTSFIDPEILAIDEDKLADMMAQPELAGYRHIVEDITRARAHTLPAEQEALLSQFAEASGSPDQVFTMLSNVDLQFEDVIDEDGNPAPLSNGSFGSYRESKNQAVRKDSFEKLHGAYAKHINTIAANYAGQVRFDNAYARIRDYNSACEAALFNSNVPVSVYDALVEAIHGALPTMRRYLELRKKVLGLSELNMYDLYVPMVEEIDYPMPFEDGKALVKKALAPLGERYASLLDKAFSEHWIDVYENKGKSSGAYSCGVYGSHSFVLLNYNDTLDDAFTLAHELGHAMHSYFSNETQDYANSRYFITVAEVASTVNEVLLTKYLLATETDPARRAYVLNHFLEGFRTTVFRQTLFAEFERQAHELDQNGTPLTADLLNKVYHDLNALYYDGAVINPLQDVEWARIPHFYTAFYVYQYATGFCSAVAIANDIITTGDASRYLKFLTTGGSDYPLEELKIAGVDLTKPDTVASAMKVFSDSLDELETLLNK
jgi:oligoendopeptidase F